MGSSARKKREKKKDFQKTKLKVGKARPKADNFTDTSFRAKAIVLSAQSLNTSAPTSASQLNTHLSLLSSRSRTDSQRRESIAFLSSLVTTTVKTTSTATATSTSTSFPIPVATLLPQLLPHLLSASAGLRNAVLGLLRLLPREGVRDEVKSVGMYVRAALTHLSVGVRGSGVEGVDVLLGVMGTGGEGEGGMKGELEAEVEVEGDMWSQGGEWGKLLAAFLGGLGWMPPAQSVGEGGGGGQAGGWTGSGGIRGVGGLDEKARARAMTVLAALLRAGLLEAPKETEEGRGERNGQTQGDDVLFPLHLARAHQIPKRMAAYEYLGLFNDGGKDGKAEAQGMGKGDREDRLKMFWKRYRWVVNEGIQLARGEGGEVGRAAALVAKVLDEVGREMDGRENH